MTVAIQVVTDLITTGALYTLVAVGLSLIFSIMNIVNFAQAQFYMVGAYVVLVVYGREKIPYGLAVLVALVATGVFGAFAERLLVRPVVRDPSRAMMSTLGLLLTVDGVVLAIFSANPQFVAPPIAGVVSVAGASVSELKLVAACFALIVVSALFVALKWTKFGLALRAIAQNERGATVQGIRVGAMQVSGFAIGAALAGLAGALILPITSVTPQTGDDLIVNMFVILIIGGVGSLGGVVAGAFVFAAFQTVGVTYFGQYSILGVYLLVIAILLIKPEGILGRAKA